MSWFRFYSDTIKDPKIRRLSLAHRWLWVAILSLAKESPEPGRLLLSHDVPVTREDLSDSASIPLKQVTGGLQILESQRMIHFEGDIIVVTHWDDRQFTSDGSNERVKRYRSKKRNTDVTLHDRYSNDVVTPPDHRVQSTDTESDPDKRSESDLARAEIVKAYTEVCGDLPEGQPPKDFDQLLDTYDADGFEARLVITALHRSVEADHPGAYALSILKSWKRKGITTMQELAREGTTRAGPRAGNSQGGVGSTANGQKDERYTAFYELFPDA